MHSISDFLLQIIKTHRDILLLWFSDYIYQQVVTPKHPLQRLNALVDWSGLETACRDFHKHNGMGCPITHSVAHLMRALIVRYLYDYSLRETETAVREHIPVKQFVGYPLHSHGLSYSTLSRFENYVCQQHPRLFFDEVLRQIDAAFPAQRLKPQIADTFAMLANAQKETLVGRLRHAAALLLLTLHQQTPARFYALTAELELSALVGAEQERAEFLLDRAEKEARLSATVTQVVALLRLLEQYPNRDKGIRRQEKMLRDVLAKEVELTTDAAGSVLAVRQFTERERGTFRPTSATDPDATIRNHGAGKQDNGYNIHVLATRDFVREIQATTGSQPDAAGIVPMLAAQLEHHDLLPTKLIYDQAAGFGQTLAAVADATAGQTQLVVKPVQAAKKKGDAALGPLDCRLTEQVNTETGEIVTLLVCPQAETTTIRFRSGSAFGWNYRMPAAKCAGCLLFTRCRQKIADPKRPRQWFISDHRVPLLAALAYAATPAFKLDMKLRPQIERVIAGLVLHCGARHAHFRGLEKVDFQVKMCGTAYNLKRWLNLSDPHYKTRPRRTAAQNVLRLASAA